MLLYILNTYFIQIYQQCNDFACINAKMLFITGQAEFSIYKYPIGFTKLSKKSIYIKKASK